MRASPLLVLLALPATAEAQSLVVHPFLQDATPTSIWIVWETDGGDESRVDFGFTPGLGTTVMGTRENVIGGARVHSAQLIDLRPETRYHYRVKTGAAESPIYAFKTPPVPSSERAFSIVAMSDMQRDRANPDVFRRIVEEGILRVMREGADLVDALAFVLVPGDLVDNGLDVRQWREEYFAPARPLFAEVPHYPVLGNHELDTPSYFRYFHLPENGSVGFEEHWWFSDYGNLRTIGLDSNGRYRNATQLAWLDQVLEEACILDSIDFVFAELHHPFRSELWIAGEIDWTGQVVARLEAFASRCGKPSIHFFGHTHGYARGQSRDHRHLWVDVATAGGNIDYFGEYPQRDYEEFSVSQDEWGFVRVDVEAGAEPSFRLRRYSHGDERARKDNAITDELHVRRYNRPPERPNLLVPRADNEPSCLTLASSPYSDADGDLLGAVHWQLAARCDFASPIVDRWRQHENWFARVDRQAGDDLLDERIEGLAANTRYCARVRHRDRGLAWSEWSPPVEFETGVSSLTENLLRNGGAEDGTRGWRAVVGPLESLAAGECNGTTPYRGDRYFAVGGLCRDEAPLGEARQEVDVSMHAAAIDAGRAVALYRAHLRSFDGSDEPAIELAFLATDGRELGRSARVAARATEWTATSSRAAIPREARRVVFVLHGVRNAGTDNDSYVDEASLVLSLDGAPECQPALAPAPPDAGVRPDLGALDAAAVDVGGEDAEPISDAAFADATPEDAASVDAGADALEPAPSSCGCRSSGREGGLAAIILALLATRGCSRSSRTRRGAPRDRAWPSRGRGSRADRRPPR